MPQIILGPNPTNLDGSVRKAAYSFLEKLSENDTSPGLHIEPITGSADPRVRTGRVNDFWRAVLVRLQGQSENAHYIYLGTYPHDEAIKFAKTASVRINPQNGIAELIAADQTSIPADQSIVPKPKPDDIDNARYSLLETQGITLSQLTELGVDQRIAERALAAVDDDELISAVETAPSWQADALLDLSVGTRLDEVKLKLGISAPEVLLDNSDDQQVLKALAQPAAQMDFAFIDNTAELRDAIEDPDFAKWRVFLHPEQRDYVFKNRNGSFRLSGAAGTGKTIVLVYRAHELAQKNPAARIVLTTFNRTLARSLKETLLQLDRWTKFASRVGNPGIYVASVDSIARGVLDSAERQFSSTDTWAASVAEVLGPRSPFILDPSTDSLWTSVIQEAGNPEVPESLSRMFLISEYQTIILPNRVTTQDQYLRVKRSGRGTALSRADRLAVWQVIAAYRAAADANGSTDYDEKAMIAATWLKSQTCTGTGFLADHVLVDEAQDLTPARLTFLRSLVPDGPNDLFLAEDSQQRIYGNRFTLSSCGINIRGRSRRLTLNYRTTAQNLGYAVNLLSGENWVDMENTETDISGVHSARTGPAVRELDVDSVVALYDLVAELIEVWLQVDSNPDEISVLVRDRQTGEMLLNALAERDVNAKFISENDSITEEYVSVMTMHRAKGMEFRQVIMLLDQDPVWLNRTKNLPAAERADADLRERSLQYVAATRARDELVVIRRI